MTVKSSTATESRSSKRPLVSVWILPFLALSLTACVTTVPVSPHLTRDCDYPVIEGETWRDLALAYERRGEALKECTDRMRAVRGL